MLKLLAILWMFLVVFCAYGGAQKVQDKDSHQRPATPVPAIPQQQHDRPPFNTEKQQDVHAKVEVVNTPKKDFYDKAPFWVNLALVFVALGTGIMVGWQSYATSRAAKASEAQAKIASEAIILQYRPRIIVRHAKIVSFSDEVPEGIFSKPVRCIVSFHIVNSGGSPAHIVEGDIYLISARRGHRIEEAEVKESTHVGISPRTLQPGQWEIIEFGLDTRIPNDARWIELYRGVSSHSIVLLGTIWYQDKLGIPRQTGLHREYDPKTRVLVRRKDSEDENSD